MAAADQLTGLLNLISGIRGQEQTTTTGGGTQTQQTQLSDTAVQEQIRRILAGSGGVRDIGNAARRSGLYNSTTEEMLLGDLYARAAAQGEIARAPIVTTSAPQTQTTRTEGAGVGATLGTIAGAAALSQLLNLGGDALTNGIGNLFGGGSTSGNSGNPLEGVATSFGVGPDSSIGLSGSISDGPGGFSGDAFGAQVGLGQPGVSGEGVGASGNFGIGQNEDFDLVGSIGSALSGFFSGGGLGGLVGAISGGTGAGGGTGGGGGSVGTSGGSIICTALMERGDLDEHLYEAGSKYIAQVSPLTKVGYYYWAEGVADKIRKGSRFWNLACRHFARGRTALLASSGSLWDHLKHPLGTLTKFAGEPACWAIGAVIMLAKFHRMKLAH